MIHTGFEWNEGLLTQQKICGLRKNLNKIMVTEVLMGNGIHEDQGVKNTEDKGATI